MVDLPVVYERRSYEMFIGLKKEKLVISEKVVSYFADIRGYKAFIEYWNTKL